MTIVKQQSIGIPFVRYKFCFICWVQNIVTSQQFGFIDKYVYNKRNAYLLLLKRRLRYVLPLYRMTDNIPIYTKICSRHDIAEILLTLALTTNQSVNIQNSKYEGMSVYALLYGNILLST